MYCRMGKFDFYRKLILEIVIYDCTLKEQYIKKS